MKLLQNSLRALIVVGSLGGFFSGWAWFAHTGKPVAAATDNSQPAIVAPAPLPTLAPLNFSNSVPGGLQQLQPLQPLPQMPQTSQQPRVRLRSRGS